MSMGTIGDASIIECALSRTRVLKAIKDRAVLGAVSILISCQKCEKIASMRGKSQWDPTRVTRTFRNAGWEVDGEGRDARCPDCKKARRDRSTEIPIGKSVAPPPPSSPAATSLSLVPDLAGVREIASVIDEKLAQAGSVARPVAKETSAPIVTQTPKPKAPTGKPRATRTYSPHVCAYKPCSKTFIPTGCKAKYCSHACQRAFHGRPAEFEDRPRAKRVSSPERASPDLARTPRASKAPKAPKVKKTSRTRSEPPRVAAARARSKATATAETTSVGAAAPQTPEEIKAERKMYVLLEAHYLPEDNHYESGWNDTRLATESGVAAARVKFVREGLYGTAIDPAVAELGAAIEAAIEANTAERTDLQELVRETLERHDKTLRDLKARLAKLTEES